MARQQAGSGKLTEVLFEFHRVGAYMKVCAIDPVTGTEVSVAGPASGSQELLKRTAIAKLEMVIKKKATG